MYIEKASRKQAKIKVGLSGSSGSGKTFSALLIAYGLCSDYTKMCVIDSEARSASLYSHVGDFQVINLAAPYNPEKYIEAIQLCERAGIEVIIIDSCSHEWSGKGGCLDLHEKEISKMRMPNSFTAWAAITPRHQAFIDAIIFSNCHIICTFRSKTEYVLTERNNKMVPQKMGLAPITRDGFDYELSLSFELDQQHKAFCSKDRTGLFMDQEPFIISANTGIKILEWCNQGEPITAEEVSQRIGECRTIQELLTLYQEQTTHRDELKPEFEAQKCRILINNEAKSELLTKPLSKNGTQ